MPIPRIKSLPDLTSRPVPMSAPQYYLPGGMPGGTQLSDVVVTPEQQLSKSRLTPINAPQSANVSLPVMSGGMITKPENTDRSALSKLSTYASQVAPFASNIANTFRKAPGVPRPRRNNQLTLRKINLDNDRNNVERGIRGANLNVDKNLDENTAAAVKSYNLAQRYNQLSGISQTENNANTQIANQETLTNAQIAAGNNAQLDQFDRDNVERRVAQQRESSQNLANASDKYQAIQNEKAKANLDVQRFGVISAMYNRNGVAGRTFRGLNDAGINVTPDYYGSDMSAQENDVMSKLDAIYRKNRRSTPTTFKTGGRLRPIN